MIGKTTRCLACNEWIVWGIKNARMHPFNVNFDQNGRPHQSGSHKLTCKNIDQLLPRSEKTTSALVERRIEDAARWRASCYDAVSTSPRILRWNGVFIHDVPEKHAIPSAHKLTERGGPFANWHYLDLLEHFRAIAVPRGFCDVGPANGCDLQYDSWAPLRIHDVRPFRYARAASCYCRGLPVRTYMCASEGYHITKCVIFRSLKDIRSERNRKMKDFQWKRLDKANREMASRLEKLRKVRANGDKHGIKIAEMKYFQALQCVWTAAVDAASPRKTI